MKPTEPLPLFHSWPIFSADYRFELGWTGNRGSPDKAMVGVPDIDEDFLARHDAGHWVCELCDDSLTWSGKVYDLFGLPRDADLTRTTVVKQYCEPSRAAMERLRAYAIKHRRGFTLDAEIVSLCGERRWMRLMAAPVCIGNQVVRLVGTKRLIPS